MKPDLLKKQIKMGIAIYPARSAVEHTGPWLLLPLITPQQLHREHTAWLWTLPELCLWLQAEQEWGYLKNVVNIHEISLPPRQHLPPALGTSGKLARFCLLLVIEREERKENNPGQTSQIHKDSHNSTPSWDPPTECSKAEEPEHCRTCPLPSAGPVMCHLVTWVPNSFISIGTVKIKYLIQAFMPTIWVFSHNVFPWL